MSGIIWIENPASDGYLSPAESNYSQIELSFITMYKSCGLCQISNIKNTRGIQLDLIFSNIPNNILTSIVPESKCIKSNSIHHNAIETSIDILGSCEIPQKYKSKIISLKKSGKFLTENFLLYISDEDIKEAMFDSCNNLLNKYDLVTQQFFHTQEKFSRYKLINESGSPTKQEFHRLIKKKEASTS